MKDIQSRIEMMMKVFMEKKMLTGKNESGTKEENNEMLGLSVALPPHPLYAAETE